MEEEKKDKHIFYNKINKLYEELVNEKNPQDKRNLRQELIETVWKTTRDTVWKKYADIVTETIINCISEKSKYDKSKGSFSNYMLRAIQRNVNKEITNDRQIKKRETPIERQNEDGDDYYITDYAELSANTVRPLTGIQKIHTIDELKEDFSRIETALAAEQENQKEKSTFVTRDILYILKKSAIELQKDERVFGLAKNFSFINKELWIKYFYNNNKLITEERLAESMGIKKSNASKMMSRFYERLRKSIDKFTEE